MSSAQTSKKADRSTDSHLLFFFFFLIVTFCKETCCDRPTELCYLRTEMYTF